MIPYILEQIFLVLYYCIECQVILLHFCGRLQKVLHRNRTEQETFFRRILGALLAMSTTSCKPIILKQEVLQWKSLPCLMCETVYVKEYSPWIRRLS